MKYYLNTAEWVCRFVRLLNLIWPFLDLNDERFQTRRIVLAKHKTDRLQNEQNQLDVFSLKTIWQIVEDVKQQLVADDIEGVHLRDQLEVVVEHLAVDVVEVVGDFVEFDVFGDHGLQEVGADLRSDVCVQHRDQQRVLHHQPLGSQSLWNQTWKRLHK